MEAYVQLELIGRGGQGSVCTVRHVAEVDVQCRVDGSNSKPQIRLVGVRQ